MKSVEVQLIGSINVPHWCLCSSDKIHFKLTLSGEDLCK